MTSRSFADEFEVEHDSIWLNTAHQGRLPKRAAEALAEAVRWKLHPQMLATSQHFTEVPARLRAALARLLGAQEDEVVLTNSASYGPHLVANGLELGPGDEVVVPANDFPSDILPWLRLRDRGVTVRMVEPADEVLTPDEVNAALTDRTRVVCLTWVHSFSGCVADLTGIGEVCRAHGVWFVVNGSQGVGVLPLDVPQKGRFDVFGTANFFNFVPFTAAVELLLELGIDQISAFVDELVLQLLPGIDPTLYRLVSRRDVRSPLVVLEPLSGDAAGVHQRLLSAGVHVAHRRGRIRISPHLAAPLQHPR